MVRKTSLDAYRAVYTNGQAQHIRCKVFDFIANNPKVTKQEIADKSEYPINVVTPRVKELIGSRLIKENGKRESGYLLEVVA